MLAATLAAQIAAFAGAPVSLDPRLAPPDCTAPPTIAWAPPGRDAVTVSCAAPAWRLFVPVVGAVIAGPPAPTLRRGDIVTVVAGGPGFRISIAAIVEEDAAAGARATVRNRASGERLRVVVGPDGETWLPGFNAGGIDR